MAAMMETERCDVQGGIRGAKEYEYQEYERRSETQGIDCLPDELLLHIFGLVDVPELLTLSRVSYRLRSLALDRRLHVDRLRDSTILLSSFLPRRPPLRSLQPPTSQIYLSRTHVAARRLRFRLLSATLNRALSRRPSVSSLVNQHVLPIECCRRDRSGHYTISQSGLFQKKRKLELEKFKEGMRIWLERKAHEIKKRKTSVGGVGILVWRFTKRVSRPENQQPSQRSPRLEYSPTGHVRFLKRFWEDMGNESGTAQTSR